MTTKFNAAPANKMVKRVLSLIQNADPVLSQIHNRVIMPGWKKQFKTRGKHWNGSEWQERGYLTQLFRGYQNGEAKAGDTLIHSGFTAGRLEMKKTKYTLTSYSPLKHVQELQRGKSGSFKVTFTKKGRLKKNHTVTMSGMPGRQIYSKSLTPAEIKECGRLAQEHYNRELR